MSDAPRKSRLIAWLELCRISNLPTVWTNVLTGCAISWGFGWHAVYRDGSTFVPEYQWKNAAILGAALSLFYIAGMALNDVADAAIDQKERPGRPIPSGRVSRTAALNFIVTCFATGLLILWWHQPASMGYALLLLVMILAYDFTHKAFPASVLFMGACRSLVILAAATGASSSQFNRVALPLAAIMGVYIVAITIIARGETENRIDQRKWLSVVMPIMLLAMFAIIRPTDWKAPALAAFILSLWLAQPVRFVFSQPPQTIKAILTWLSGICLIDAYILTLLGALPLALLACACFILTAWGHRKILGT